MGYSTSLYLVDLAKVSAMVGSQDAAAKIRICALATANEGDRTPTDLKIYVTLDGELIVNGALLPLDAFEAELANPKNEGRAVCYFKRDSKNAEEGKRRGAGRFPSELGFVKYLDDAMRRTGVRYSCRSNYSTEEAYYAAPQPELDVETAIVHLVDGTTVSEFEDAFQYGYALEYICQDNAIDSWKIEGKRRLSHLKIKSVLFKNRSPVVLPEYDDFPEIGYLSTLEATKELSTVFSRDQLKLDTDANIASDREIVITAVERSVDCNQSLIGFYY